MANQRAAIYIYMKKLRESSNLIAAAGSTDRPKEPSSSSQAAHAPSLREYTENHRCSAPLLLLFSEIDGLHLCKG